jgi:DNA-binding HxlR family transcriptional regulator
MVGKRKYDDGCAVAQALDVIGERWALLVVRDLVLGPKRFTDLLAGLPGASSDVLTQRLRELTEAGVVHRRRLAPPASTWVYELTPWGAELEDLILGLAGWVHQSPRMRYDLPLGTDSLMLSLKTLFDGNAAGDLHVKIALHLGDERFSIRVADGNLTIARAETESPDAILDTDPATLLSLLRANRALDEVIATGQLRLEGDRPSVELFTRLFPVPKQPRARTS